MKPIRLPYYLLLLLLTLRLSAPAAMAQDDVREAPSLRPEGETYRVRVQNVEWGRVEASADGGLHYALIGRVRRPATRAAEERGATTIGVVLRGGRDGLAFTVGPNRVVKLRPQPPATTSHGFHLPAPTVPAEIVTNIPSGSGLFGELAPVAGATVRLQPGPQPPAPIAPDHVLTTDDRFVFIFVRSAGNAQNDPDARQAAVSERIAALARSYLASAIGRAHAEGRPVYNGTLTLRAKLAEDEPDPIAAVTYTIDDDLIAAQNVGPYAFDWDTRRAADGEHVVEISALNRNGRIITHARALIVVNNGTLAAGAKPAE